MSAPELRTPAEWSALDGVTVMDPDGWRGTRDLPAKSWDEPISHDEWQERLSVSTRSLHTVQAEHVEPAVAKAVEKGHTVKPDPPAAMTAARRWTCTRCGDSVLDYLGNVYGGAVDRTCDESVAFWGERA